LPEEPARSVPPRSLHRWCYELPHLLADHTIRPVSAGLDHLTAAVVAHATCTLTTLALAVPSPATPGMTCPQIHPAAIFLGHGGRWGQVTIGWPQPHGMPWVVESSRPLPGRVGVKRYVHPLRIEAKFVEWKRRSWQLEGNRLSPERLDRLLIGLVLTQWWLKQLGQRGSLAGRRRYDASRQQSVSVGGPRRREVAERLSTGRTVPRLFRWRDGFAVISWFA